MKKAALKYINKIEHVDDSEMEKILKDQSLLTKLKKGSKDAKTMKGRFQFPLIKD